MNIDSTITAPASKDHPYGTVEVSLDGEKITQRPLIALHAVNEGSFFQRIVDDIRLFFQ